MDGPAEGTLPSFRPPSRAAFREGGDRSRGACATLPKRVQRRCLSRRGGREGRVDRVSETSLGPGTLAELSRTLRPVDCQTCGRAFGRRDAVALAVDAMDDLASVSLHHRGCRPPGWRELETPDQYRPPPHQTWRARLLKVTAPGRDELVFLVNPSCECGVFLSLSGTVALLTRDKETLADFRADIVIGTPEQFMAVRERHRQNAADWGRRIPAPTWPLSRAPRSGGAWVTSSPAIPRSPSSERAVRSR